MGERRHSEQEHRTFDLSTIVIALERSGGWLGQPGERIAFFVHLVLCQGHLSWATWQPHIGGCWYGGKWWSPLILPSQN